MEQAQNKGSELHITADKRETKDSPKLPSATSFIRKTLGDILLGGYIETIILKKLEEVELIWRRSNA